MQFVCCFCSVRYTRTRIVSSFRLKVVKEMLGTLDIVLISFKKKQK